MVRITVKRTDHIESMEIKGHAGSDVYGHDLVCAIVSGIATGLANAVYEMLHEEDIELREGYVSIRIHQPSGRSDDIMNTALIMLKTAEEANKDFLRISEV